METTPTIGPGSHPLLGFHRNTHPILDYVVIFIIIFAARELDLVARFGYDHRATEPFDPDVDAAVQVREGKTFPGLPIVSTGEKNPSWCCSVSKRINDLGNTCGGS